jgi:hypothetical protein
VTPGRDYDEAGAAHTIRRLREEHPENGPLGNRKVEAGQTPTTEMERLHRLATHRLMAMTEGKRVERDLRAAVARLRAALDAPTDGGA